MGGVAIFAANKRGEQGAIGLAEEMLAQLAVPIRLPMPATYANAAQLATVSQYLANEFGAEWIGTRLLRAGVILHHGDIPQETREVFESLLRDEHIRVAICTNTLAEGVNLPIRTLVLYSVQRSGAQGRPVPLLARDIKNLVGRAGRAGSTTRGLVICANENQWPIVEPVARQQPGENVLGALRVLLKNAQRALALRNARLTNELLEGAPNFFPLVDGIDNVLVDLIAEEIGDDQLLLTAQQIADHTFAAITANAQTKSFLNEIVRFRATRIAELRAQGRLGWVKETGARVRTIKQVETGLLPLRPTWDDIADVTDNAFVTALLTWAWSHRETRTAVIETYRIEPDAVPTVQAQIFQIVRLWLSGETYDSIARSSALPVDNLLGVLSRVVGFTLQTIVEQGISLLKKLLEEQGRALSPAVERFPDHLKYGLPSLVSVTLAAAGVRHRRAAFLLGETPRLKAANTDSVQLAASLARSELLADRALWSDQLGSLVFEHTTADLAE